MDFYNTRFDFIKVADENINAEELVQNIIMGEGSVAEKQKQIKELWKKIDDYCLAIPKQKFQISETDFLEVGDANIVDGSTCFFINTGDLYIYKETYSLNSFTGEYMKEGSWYKVGGFNEENKGKYMVVSEDTMILLINPYYSGGDEPVPPVG